MFGKFSEATAGIFTTGLSRFNDQKNSCLFMKLFFVETFSHEPALEKGH
jgi:hypothetical protein